MTNDFYVPPRKKLKWLGVDLDQTIAYPTWKPDQSRAVIGDPIPENIAKLQEAVDAGYKPVIYTARHWSEYEMIEAWLENFKIPYSRILCGKPLFHRFVDDKNILPTDERWF